MCCTCFGHEGTGTKIRLRFDMGQKKIREKKYFSHSRPVNV